MEKMVKQIGLALALGATALTAAAPADAQGYYRRGGDGAGTAIIAGIAGLAIGAAIASSNHDRRYQDDRRYDDARYEEERQSDAVNGYDDERQDDARDGYYQGGYRGSYSQGGYYQNGYSQSGYAPGGGEGRPAYCHVERRWDGYSGRSVIVRICR